MVGQIIVGNSFYFYRLSRFGSSWHLHYVYH